MDTALWFLAIVGQCMLALLTGMIVLYLLGYALASGARRGWKRGIDVAPTDRPSTTPARPGPASGRLRVFGAAEGVRAAPRGQGSR